MPANGVLNKTRENWFVAAYVSRVSHAITDLVKLDEGSQRTALLAIAMAAVLDAGYRRVARSTLAQKKQAEYLIGLPRIQQAVSHTFEKQGASLKDCGKVLADIMHGRIADTTVAERLRAIDLTLKATVGFASAKSSVVSTQVPPDQFFDPEIFGQAPPIDVTPQGVDDPDDEDEDE